jgi:hypothetical protein
MHAMPPSVIFASSKAASPFTAVLDKSQVDEFPLVFLPSAKV